MIIIIAIADEHWKFWSGFSDPSDNWATVDFVVESFVDHQWTLPSILAGT